MVMLYDKVKLWGPALILLLAGIAGCQQNSIFHDIANEVPPVEPLISGSPSKIVKSDSYNKLYVTNGKIYEFDLGGNGRWYKSDNRNINGQIRDVAAAGNSLYALSIVGTGLDFRVWKKTKTGDADGTWEPLEIKSDDTHSYTTVNTIFGAGKTLFAGASKSNGSGGNDYAILYEAGGKLVFLIETAGILSGAGKIVDDAYYLGTMGSGIFRWDGTFAIPATVDPDCPPLPDGSLPTIPTNIAGFLQPDPTNIAGFLQPDPSYIIAASRNGVILTGTAEGFRVAEKSLGYTLTGALALSKAYDYGSNNKANPPDPDGDVTLLLFGIQGGSSSYNHGYRETVIDTDTWLLSDSSSSREPGNTKPTGIATNGNYTSTLKRFPVTAIFALEHISASNTNPIMFAATPGDGFYSYRNRSGTWQWNHED
ncbi:hypothetical protein AGMMS4952_07900 [Spirochaetia bacterium]|nr:hypothetical protein AGMMS4952_07900 [Spirochaetia bacterium]